MVSYNFSVNLNPHQALIYNSTWIHYKYQEKHRLNDMIKCHTNNCLSIILFKSLSLHFWEKYQFSQLISMTTENVSILQGWEFLCELLVFDKNEQIALLLFLKEWIALHRYLKEHLNCYDSDTKEQSPLLKRANCSFRKSEPLFLKERMCTEATAT